jgi:hypothetical protein
MKFAAVLAFTAGIYRVSATVSTPAPSPSPPTKHQTNTPQAGIGAVSPLPLSTLTHPASLHGRLPPADDQPDRVRGLRPRLRRPRRVRGGDAQQPALPARRLCRLREGVDAVRGRLQAACFGPAGVLGLSGWLRCC